jgi:hypothetical protein
MHFLHHHRGGVEYFFNAESGETRWDAPWNGTPNTNNNDSTDNTDNTDSNGGSDGGTGSSSVHNGGGGSDDNNDSDGVSDNNNDGDGGDGGDGISADWDLMSDNGAAAAANDNDNDNNGGNGDATDSSNGNDGGGGSGSDDSVEQMETVVPTAPLLARAVSAPQPPQMPPSIVWPGPPVVPLLQPDLYAEASSASSMSFRARVPPAPPLPTASQAPSLRSVVPTAPPVPTLQSPVLSYVERRSRDAFQSNARAAARVASSNIVALQRQMRRRRDDIDVAVDRNASTNGDGGGGARARIPQAPPVDSVVVADAPSYRQVQGRRAFWEYLGEFESYVYTRGWLCCFPSVQ